MNYNYNDYNNNNIRPNQAPDIPARQITPTRKPWARLVAQSDALLGRNPNTRIQALRLRTSYIIQRIRQKNANATNQNNT